MIDRKDCPMRSENGNCLPVGGFCTAVSDVFCKAVYHAYDHGFSDAIEELQKQVPKWIPVSERLPEEPFGCLIIVDDTDPYTGRDFLNYLPYFAGWDGEQWNDGDGQQIPFEIRYWMPLPPIPKEET